MQYFFSVDWGTSSLRVRLIEITDNSIIVLHELSNHYGCSYVFDLFKSEKTGIAREDYFLNFLRRYLVVPGMYSEKNIPVVISGMATSSIGIREIPYAPLPFVCDGSSLQYDIIPHNSKFNHDVLLLSGLCGMNDVMRGEEIQLLGLQNHNHSTDALFILPGTHSKHIRVKENNIISFKTYITGELFQILSTYSLLKNNIVKSSSMDKEAFKKGLALSKENLLHNVFTIRASALLHNIENSSNYSLLSGLLIGTELRDIASLGIPIYLCAHANLSDSYAFAIQELSLQKQCTIVPAEQVDKSVIYGQKMILERIWNQQGSY